MWSDSPLDRIKSFSFLNFHNNEEYISSCLKMNMVCLYYIILFLSFFELFNFYYSKIKNVGCCIYKFVTKNKKEEKNNL